MKTWIITNKEKISRIICYVASMGISVLYFWIFDLFCVANDHSIMENILVWSGIILMSYYSVFVLWLATRLFWKDIPKIKALDLKVLFAISIVLVIVCLCFAEDIDSYSYLSVYGYLSGIFGLVIAIHEIGKSKNEKNNHQQPQKPLNK